MNIFCWINKWAEFREEAILPQKSGVILSLETYSINQCHPNTFILKNKIKTSSWEPLGTPRGCSLIFQGSEIKSSGLDVPLNLAQFHLRALSQHKVTPLTSGSYKHSSCQRLLWLHNSNLSSKKIRESGKYHTHSNTDSLRLLPSSRNIKGRFAAVNNSSGERMAGYVRRLLWFRLKGSAMLGGYLANGKQRRGFRRDRGVWSLKDSWWKTLPKQDQNQDSLGISQFPATRVGHW